MKRRHFLETTALGCALVITKPASLLASSNHIPTPLKDFDLEEVTISALQAGMQSGKYA